jgi:hypothetical protein
MNKLINSTAVLMSGLGLISSAVAGNGTPLDPYSMNPFTLAVYGDAPYGCKSGSNCPTGYSSDTANGPNPGDPRQLDATPAFIAAVNADPKVDLVLHAGDIHAGQQFCTLAYDQRVYDLWAQFADPLVYTPGDNEWTDCHKSGEGGNKKDSAGHYVDYANGHPLANLALVRSIFFPSAGDTLGGRKKQVISQALAHDAKYPSDAEYVENVMWEQSKVLFVTLNIPGGSNNDADVWFGGATQTGEQKQEIQQRTDADLRWLDAAFDKAQVDGARAVLIAEQADMWDLDGNPSAHIANYKVFMEKIAERAAKFGKPVLLINGDSHMYRSDNPLQSGAPCKTEDAADVTDCSDDAWDNQQPNGFTPDVSNFHRLVVHGSTFPLEYLRLTVNPRANADASDNAFGPFSWTRVVSVQAPAP